MKKRQEYELGGIILYDNNYKPIASEIDKSRAPYIKSNDFTGLRNSEFKYFILNEGDFQKRNQFVSITKLRNLLRNIEYNKLIISGWDLLEFWFLLLSNPKSKNCLALESTIYESKVKGLKGLIKKIFLSNISTVFVSGNLHVKLLKALNYIDTIKITKGVGIINKPKITIKGKTYKRKFLYVGRISRVKNLEILIEVFNNLPDYQLSLIGNGSDIEYLKKKSYENINFLGAIDNKKLKTHFQKNDIFILPSISEPWGLVVEEALYFGLPVIVSKHCGSSELIINGINGYLINPNNYDDIINTILKVDDIIYNDLLDGVRKFSINKKDKIQVNTYV